MTVKELIDKLSSLSPDTEIVGGVWNGRMDTYTVLDEVHVFPYDQISADFYGTAGAFDEKLLHIQSKDVVYLESFFDSLNKQVAEDRRVVWRMERILRMHRSREWKKEKVLEILTEFADESFDRKLKESLTRAFDELHAGKVNHNARNLFVE